MIASASFRGRRYCLAALLWLLGLMPLTTGAWAESLTPHTTHPDSLHKLVFLTEDAPPSNYVRDNRIVGVGVDVLAHVIKASNSNRNIAEIRLLPWARAYRQLQQDSNIVLFGTARTRAREEMFQWAGPIFDSSYVLIRRRSDVRPFSIESLRDLSIATVRDDVAETILLEKAPITRKNLTQVSSEQALRLLLRGRVDAFAHDRDTAYAKIIELGLNMRDFDVAWMMQDSPLYFAFSKDVDPAIVGRFQAVIDRLTESGDLHRIRHRHFSRAFM